MYKIFLLVCFAANDIKSNIFSYLRLKKLNLTDKLTEVKSIFTKYRIKIFNSLVRTGNVDRGFTIVFTLDCLALNYIYR